MTAGPRCPCSLRFIMVTGLMFALHFESVATAQSTRPTTTRSSAPSGRSGIPDIDGRRDYERPGPTTAASEPIPDDADFPPAERVVLENYRKKRVRDLEANIKAAREVVKRFGEHTQERKDALASVQKIVNDRKEILALSRAAVLGEIAWLYAASSEKVEVCERERDDARREAESCRLAGRHRAAELASSLAVGKDNERRQWQDLRAALDGVLGQMDPKHVRALTRVLIHSPETPDSMKKFLQPLLDE